MRKKAEIEKKTLMEGFSKLKAKGAALNRSEFQKLASKLNIPVSASEITAQIDTLQNESSMQGRSLSQGRPGGSVTSPPVQRRPMPSTASAMPPLPAVAKKSP